MTRHSWNFWTLATSIVLYRILCLTVGNVLLRRSGHFRRLQYRFENQYTCVPEHCYGTHIFGVVYCLSILLLTNSPSPVNRVKGMPPIGKADHDIVYVEYDIKAKRIQQAPRKIFLYNRADMDGLRDHLARFRDTFLSSDHSHMSVNDMWVSFKSEVIAAIERFIPTKMTKTKYSLPWIDSSIRRLIRKREKLYFRARKSSSPDVKNHYKRFRAHVQKVIRDAYWKHISNIFSFETESPDPDSPRKK